LQDIQLSKSFLSYRAELGLQAQARFETSSRGRKRRSRLLACAMPPRRCARHGGEYRARTGDLLVANQALSQLS
jgi:hypothetical protein